MFWRRKKKLQSTPTVKAGPAEFQVMAVQNPFAAGAQRLASIARTPGEQHLANLAQSQLVCTPAGECLYSSAPDERWVKQFMTQGIGPQPEQASLEPMPPVMQRVAMGSFEFRHDGQVRMEQHTQPVPVRPMREATPPPAKEKRRIGGLLGWVLYGG